MRTTRLVAVMGVLLACGARLEAQLQSSNPPEQAWMQGDNLPDLAESNDWLGGADNLLAIVQGVLATGDFDDDGYLDLAIGVPLEDLVSGAGNLTNAGIVHVIYGRSWGLDPTTVQTLLQGSGGLLDSAQGYDFFGSALASGDFDADGTDDLAIGVTGQNIGSASYAGAVHIVYGEAGSGLGARDAVIYQGLFPSSDQAELGDNFGAILAVGDFNGDTIDDLAVGTSRDDVAGWQDAGLVVVYLARAKVGLANPTCQVLTQDMIPGGVSEFQDRFGYSLASGDFDGDGKSDLAIGSPLEDVGSIQDAGLVNVVYGAASGLDPSRYQTFNQQTLKEVFEKSDWLGFALVSGDFNGDSVTDLAVSAPFEDLGNISDCGVVHTLYGEAPAGLDPGGWLSQDSYLMADANEKNDRFGYTFAAGDFDGDGNDDLAIGVVGESSYSGAVSVVHGSLFGLHTQGNQWWTQSSPNVDTYPEPNDLFGAGLAAGDFDRNGAADLAIGVPLEEGSTGQTDFGIVHTLYGL